MNIDQIYKAINADVKENILRTLVEIITNTPLELPPTLNKNS